MLKACMWIIDGGKLNVDDAHAIAYEEPESFKIAGSTALFSRSETSVNVYWDYLLNIGDNPRQRYRYFPSINEAHAHYKNHDDSFPPIPGLRWINYGGHERFVVDGLTILFEAYVVDGAKDGTWHYQLKRHGAYIMPYSGPFTSAELAAEAVAAKVSELSPSVSS